MVCKAFRYGCWYRNISMISSRPRNYQIIYKMERYICTLRWTKHQVIRENFTGLGLQWCDSMIIHTLNLKTQNTLAGWFWTQKLGYTKSSTLNNNPKLHSLRSLILFFYLKLYSMYLGIYPSWKYVWKNLDQWMHHFTTSIFSWIQILLITIFPISIHVIHYNRFYLFNHSSLSLQKASLTSSSQSFHDANASKINEFCNSYNTYLKSIMFFKL